MVHSMTFNQLKLLPSFVRQFSLDSGPLGELPESEARVKHARIMLCQKLLAQKQNTCYNKVLTKSIANFQSFLHYVNEDLIFLE